MVRLDHGAATIFSGATFTVDSDEGTGEVTINTGGEPFSVLNRCRVMISVVANAA